MAASKKATSGINRDAEKLVAKLARAGGTASGYEAVVDAGAVLALGGAFTEALACLHRVWECPEKVHRLLVQGKNPREDSFATWLYKKTGAWAAPLAVARALAIAESELLVEVRGKEAQLRWNLEDYLAHPRSWETDQTSATKTAMTLLRAIELAKNDGRLDVALAKGRELLALEASHHSYQLSRRQLIADIAFKAGAHDEAYAILKTAAAGARTIYDFLDVILSFEWSGRALVEGKLELPAVEPAGAKTLVASVEDFFARVASPPGEIAWRPLLTKLAGAKALRTGATEVELAALEKRLGTPLPPSYRAFLATSNGLAKSKKSLPLQPTKDIAWFSDENQDWIDAYLGRGAKIPHLASTLRISEPANGEVYLLNPKVKTTKGEWEAWHFADFIPGETRYATFGELVENLIEDARA